MYYFIFWGRTRLYGSEPIPTDKISWDIEIESWGARRHGGLCRGIYHPMFLGYPGIVIWVGTFCDEITIDDNNYCCNMINRSVNIVLSDPVYDSD